MQTKDKEKKLHKYHILKHNFMDCELFVREQKISLS